MGRNLKFLARVIQEDRGQDLVEYALLTGIVTTGAALLFPALLTTMRDKFNSWGTNVNAIWIPDDPQ